MLLNCSRVQALFPLEKILLEHQGPARMLWAEHGGLILKVSELKFAEIAAEGEDTGFFLDLELPPSETLSSQITEFATEQSLALPPPAAPDEACLVKPILAACHLPQQKKFIFSEDSRLEARPVKGGIVAVAVRGKFLSRTVPCQEGDIVIHLQPRDMAELLSFLLAQARKAR